MELEQKRRERWQKSPLILVLALVLVVAISGTLAWLTYVRKIQTATLVDVPEIYLEGPEDAVSQLIPLGDIDVTNGTSREYVFRIVTNKDNQYRIQFAHTTNVPFKYAIYPSSTSGTGNSVEIAGHTYYYDSELVGNYLNKSDKTITHDVTYSPSTNPVQTDAEPLYWQSGYITQPDQYSYYVLKVSWEPGLKSNKETDMVYLTVKIKDR